MKKSLSILLAVGFCAVVLLSAPVFDANAADKVVLRAVSAFPKGNYQHNRSLYRLQQRLKERIPDKVEIKFLGAADVIHPLKAVPAISKGMFDMGHIPPAYTVGELPEMTITSVVKPWSWPQCFKAPGFMELINKAVGERLNVHLLGGPVGDGPMHVVTTNKQVKKVADLKGVKFRAPGPIGSRVAKRLGSSAVSMPISQLYESMQRGVVEGGFLNLITIWDYKIYEMAKYITAPFIEFKVGIWFNKDKWQSLDPEVRKIIEEEYQNIQYEHWGYYQMGGETWTNFAKSKGITFYDMPETELKKIRKAVTDDVNDWYLKK